MDSSVIPTPASRAISSARVSCRRRNNCGVSARHRRSRGSVPSMPPSSPARFRVSRTGAARIAPTGSLRPRSSNCSMSPSARFGRAASWTRTKSSMRTSSGNAASPASTESARASPPVQVISRLPANSRQPGHCASPSASTTTAPCTFACASSARRVCAINGSPATSRYCFGTSPPKRAPRPAAGTTVQVIRRLPSSCRPGRPAPRGGFRPRDRTFRRA